MSDTTIRYMTIEDIEDVLVVEQDSFTLPWTPVAFMNELTSNQFARYLVIEVDGRIIGYGGMWLVVDEAHITNIAVHSNYRGHKYGEVLLYSMIELARTYGAQKMTLEVRVTNQPAQGLYKKFGFKPGGIRHNYYTDNGEDALVMWVELDEK